MYFRQNAKILHQYSIVVVWSVFFFHCFFFHFQACFKKGREFFWAFLLIWEHDSSLNEQSKTFFCVVVVVIVNKHHSTTNVSCLFTKQSNFCISVLTFFSSSFFLCNFFQHSSRTYFDVNISGDIQFILFFVFSWNRWIFL